MPYIAVAQGLTALREAAYLTDAGVSTSNGLEFTDATLTVSDTYDGVRGDVKHGTGGSLSPTRSGGRIVTLRLRGEMKGPGAAYTNALSQLPLYNVMLGAALSGTVGGGALTVTPVRPDKSGSFSTGFYTNDTYFLVNGCRGSLSFRGQHADRGFWEFNGQGVLAASHPVSLALPTITYTNQAKLPPVYVGDSPSLGALTPVIGGYEVTINNTTSSRGDGSATGGHSGFVITNRSVGWSFPGEVVAPATYDPFSTSLSGTTAALALAHGNGVTGQKFAFAASKASIRPPELQDDSGRLVWNLSGACNITSGNDELTITLS